MVNSNNIKRIHLVGIAGAGLNGIAHLLLDQGLFVTGADRTRNIATELLEKRGVIIVSDTDVSPIREADAMLISSAIKPDHIQVQEAKRLNIPIYTRHDLWKEWSASRQVIAVCGSHGKTTTAAMIAYIIKTMEQDCGYQFGSIVNELGSANWGQNGPLIIEADEYARTFLSLTPFIAVVTSVDPDHVDIYPDSATYEEAFRAFAEKTLVNSGKVLACGDAVGINRTLAGLSYITYGIQEGNFWRATHLKVGDKGFSFTVQKEGQELAEVHLQIPGHHNVLNALAAIAVVSYCGLEPELAGKALSKLKGIMRRLEYKGEVNQIYIFDDYAHMPREIEATIQALRAQFKYNRLVAYFQPHTFSRLNAFLHDFAEALSFADVVRLGDVYGARETSGFVNSYHLLDLVNVTDKAVVGDVLGAVKDLVQTLKPGDILAVMSAGDGTKVSDGVLSELGKRT